MRIGLTVETFWAMTPREFVAHVEAYKWRREQDDYRVGIIAATIANVARDPKRRRKPYQPRDFMPRYGGGGAQTPKHQRLLLEALTLAMGGQVRRGQATSQAPS